MADSNCSNNHGYTVTHTPYTVTKAHTVINPLASVEYVTLLDYLGLNSDF